MLVRVHNPPVTVTTTDYVPLAFWGIPGYSLKGLEKELSKRHLTKLKAEIILIRVRQSAEDFRNSTPEERDEVEAKWKALG